ncbi:MAG TPA: hypothetical protein VFO89_06470 [Thermoanaerobaculia bacterium]|nr:hypothetical protein [Thermoanaerobaculia bacterium]
MGDVDILHRIFTNAAEGGPFDEARARIVPIEERDASTALTDRSLDALDELLRKTTSASGETGWVVRRFPAEGESSYACVIVSYPDLVKGAEERAGLLNHARLVRAEGPSFDAAELIHTALELPLGDLAQQPSNVLRRYRDIGIEENAFVREVTISELQVIHREVLTDLLLAFLGGHARREHIRVARPDAGVEAIARAWAALPWALQKNSSWGFEVTESCPVDVIFTAEGGIDPASMGSETLVRVARQYVALLHDAPERFDAMLRDPSIVDVTTLADKVQKSALAPQLSFVEATPIATGREEMSKKPKPPKTPPKSEPRRDAEPQEWNALEEDVRTEMQEQFAAMKELLRRDMDDRLAAFEERLAAQGVVQPAATQAGTMNWKRVGAILAGLLAIAAIVWGVASFLPPRGTVQTTTTTTGTTQPSDTQPPTDTTASAAPAATPAQKAVKSAETTGKWAEELKAFLEAEPELTSKWIYETANRGAVPDEIYKTLSDYANRIGAKKELTSAERAKLRNLLVDCIASEVRSIDVKVDGDLADAARLLEDLKVSLGVTSKAKDLTKADLQSEIILRWMASK